MPLTITYHHVIEVGASTSNYQILGKPSKL